MPIHLQMLLLVLDTTRPLDGPGSSVTAHVVSDESETAVLLWQAQHRASPSTFIHGTLYAVDLQAMTVEVMPMPVIEFTIHYPS